MEEPKIKTWEQVRHYLEEKGVNSDSIRDLWNNLDPDSGQLGDYSIKLIGPNYQSSFRVDFAQSFLNVQKDFSHQIDDVLQSDSSDKVTKAQTSDAFLFYIQISEGSTNINFKFTKPLINAISKKVSNMGQNCFNRVVIVGFIILAIYAVEPIINGPAFMSIINNQDVQEVSSSDKNDAQIVLDKLIQYAKEQNLLTPESIQLLDKSIDAQSKITNEVFSYAEDVAEININGKVYKQNEILEIKNNQDFAQEEPLFEEDTVILNIKILSLNKDTGSCRLLIEQSEGEMKLPGVICDPIFARHNNPYLDAFANRLEDNALTEDSLTVEGLMQINTAGKRVKFHVQKVISK